MVTRCTLGLTTPTMTSNRHFWLCLLLARTHDDARVLWELSRLGAEEGIQTGGREGDLKGLNDRLSVGRTDLGRSLRRLDRLGLVEYRPTAGHGSRIRIAIENAPWFRRWRINPEPLRQLDTVNDADHPAVRIAVLRRARTEPILLTALAAAGAFSRFVTYGTRDFEAATDRAISRNTALRALDQLAADGLIEVCRSSRSTAYRLLEQPLRELVAQPCPFGPEAAAWTPGWSDHHFPMLDKLEAAAKAIDSAREASAAASQPPPGADNLEQ